MGVMYGADADELEQIAAELEGYERELGQLLREGVGAVSLVGLSTTLSSIWRGPRASEFAAIWQARHLLRIRGAQGLLKDAATDLRRNADDQRKTSAVQRGSGGRKPSPYEQGVIDRFREGTDEVHEDSVEYWRDLSDSDRAILIAHEPDWVLSLKPTGALTAEEVSAAEQSWRENAADEFDLVESETELYLRGEIDLGVYSAGAEASSSLAEVRTHNGESKYVVTFGVEGDVAKTAFGVEAGAEIKYEFESRMEAERFQSDVINGLIPDGGDLAWGFLGPGAIAAATASDVKATLDHKADHRSSAKVHGGVQGKLKLDGKGVDEGGAKLSAGGFYDLESGERGFYIDGSLEIEQELGGNFELDAGLSAKGEVVWDGEGSPKELTLELNAYAQGSLELEGFLGEFFGGDVNLDDEFNGNLGGEINAQVKLDLQNPRNQALADAFLRGDPGAIGDLMMNSEVVVDVSVVTDVGGDIDFVAGEVEYGTRHSEELVTVGRAPNSSFEVL